MKTVAFLGLGAMGSRMAAHLLAEDIRLIVHNRTKSRADEWVQKGAVWADSPRNAVAEADFIITMVTDDEASRQLWLEPERGILAGMQPGTLAIESSTLTLDWVKVLSKAVSQAGGRFLDAPVVGTRPQAEAAQLVYLLGGTESVVEQARPLLSRMGAALHHVGETGQGAALKLAVNGLFGIQVAAYAEMLGMLTRQGLSEERVAGILSELAITSPAMKVMGGLIAQRRFAPLFPIDLVHKDMQYATQTGQEVEVTMKMTQAAASTYQAAIDSGFGSDNIVGVAQLFLSDS